MHLEMIFGFAAKRTVPPPGFRHSLPRWPGKLALWKFSGGHSSPARRGVGGFLDSAHGERSLPPWGPSTAHARRGDCQQRCLQFRVGGGIKVILFASTFSTSNILVRAYVGLVCVRK